MIPANRDRRDRGAEDQRRSGGVYDGPAAVPTPAYSTKGIGIFVSALWAGQAVGKAAVMSRSSTLAEYRRRAATITATARVVSPV